MSVHRIHLEGSETLAKGEVAVCGEEAHHAIRVKRLQAGDALEVLDGRGSVGMGRVRATEKVRGEWRLVVDVAETRRVEPVRPRIDVRSPPPKGPRLGELIDGLAQVGAASWAPLETEFSGREAGEAKLERVARIAAEASKQSGRAWAMEIGAGGDLAAVLADGGAGLVMADESGAPYARLGGERIVLLVGPEGGWSAREVEAARKAGVAVARFGPHVMRVETAAVVAVGVILAAEQWVV